MDDRTLMDSHRSNIYSNFLMHWKYIKREKVGDKWKYFYDDGKREEKAYKTAKKEYSDSLSKLNKEVNDAIVKGQRSLRVDTAYDDYYKKLDQYEKAKSEYLKTPRGKGYNTVDKVKDALGVDERKVYKEAERKYNKAVDNENEADREADEAIKKSLIDPRNHYKTFDASVKVDSHKYWEEKVQTRGEEYMKAKSEYMNTPLGTALKVTETIKDIPFEVKYALKKLSKKKSK